MTKPSGRYHHGDLRSALLVRAAETLQADGIAKLSLRGIARDLGVSHTAPSKHFRDKEDLLDALVADGFRSLTNAMSAVDPSDGDTHKHLRNLGIAYFEFALENEALLTLMFSRKHAPNRSPEVIEAAGGAFAVALDVLSAARERGEIFTDDLRHTTYQSIATLQGIATIVSTGLLPQAEGRKLVTSSTRNLLRALRSP
ncbi:TetR/AcrR family transcriptional regulator [Gordonia sp. (in: high G+C Gram-positive bacteria)]|uniref:TetR/AcrR family transcriptional regulator n=1 Tax=Gordonia sp. (in: high G+C Gram-positive bacteria) TaxID=84139 RepID=UPI003F9E86E8